VDPDLDRASVGVEPMTEDGMDTREDHEAKCKRCLDMGWVWGADLNSAPEDEDAVFPCPDCAEGGDDAREDDR
jgi:hypothetical protein